MATIIKLRQNIIAQLENESNEDLLNDIQSLITSEKTDFDNSLSWETSQEFKDALDEAEQDIKKGNIHAHEEVMAYVKKKYLHGNNMVE